MPQGGKGSFLCGLQILPWASDYPRVIFLKTQQRYPVFPTRVFLPAVITSGLLKQLLYLNIAQVFYLFFLMLLFVFTYFKSTSSLISSLCLLRSHEVAQGSGYDASHTATTRMSHQMHQLLLLEPVL